MEKYDKAHEAMCGMSDSEVLALIGPLMEELMRAIGALKKDDLTQHFVAEVTSLCAIGEGLRHSPKGAAIAVVERLKELRAFAINKRSKITLTPANTEWCASARICSQSIAPRKLRNLEEHDLEILQAQWREAAGDAVPVGSGARA